MEILISSVSTGNSLPGVLTSNFSSLHAFNISSGFVSGINTLDVVVQDVGAASAFRVEVRGTANALQGVPEPGSIGLAVLAVLALLTAGAATRRRQRG